MHAGVDALGLDGIEAVLNAAGWDKVRRGNGVVFVYQAMRYGIALTEESGGEQALPQSYSPPPETVHVVTMRAPKRDLDGLCSRICRVAGPTHGSKDLTRAVVKGGVVAIRCEESHVGLVNAVGELHSRDFGIDSRLALAILWGDSSQCLPSEGVKTYCNDKGWPIAVGTLPFGSQGLYVDPTSQRMLAFTCRSENLLAMIRGIGERPIKVELSSFDLMLLSKLRG